MTPLLIIKQRKFMTLQWLSPSGGALHNKFCLVRLAWSELYWFGEKLNKFGVRLLHSLHSCRQWRGRSSVFLQRKAVWKSSVCSFQSWCYKHWAWVSPDQVTVTRELPKMQWWTKDMPGRTSTAKFVTTPDMTPVERSAILINISIIFSLYTTSLVTVRNLGEAAA